MKTTICLLLLAFSTIFDLAAEENFQPQSKQTQTIRGTVTDVFTGSPLAGAIVRIMDVSPNLLCMTQEDGSFTLTRVPIGRQTVDVSLLGYKNSGVSGVMVSSGKEIVLNIKLEEKTTQLQEVVVHNNRTKEKALNDLAVISARSFSVEETERFAGSLGDPARMVANYAGVMAGNDARNDIVIRGNSPLGVLWRLEGVEIPNPNHFGAQGTTGGAVSMLNSNLLTNSDFITGAFPAEYGNATSGVFDLNMRSGNNSKYEFTGQVGFNGFEAAAEGPIKLGKNAPKGSFIMDYRYSTLDVMSKLGFDLGTGTAIPEYQDFSMLVDLPTKSAGRFKLIALLGKSKIRLGRNFDSNEGLTTNTFGTATDFGANLAFTALTHTYFITADTKLKTTFSYHESASNTIFDTIDFDQKKYFTVYNGLLREQKSSVTTQLKHRFSNKDFLTAGAGMDVFLTNFSDSSWVRDINKKIAVRELQNKPSSLLKTYAEFQHKFSDDLLINYGLNFQYYNLSKEASLEPRASVKWQLAERQSLSFGYGMHSQTQSRLLSFTKDYDKVTGTYAEKNHNLKSTKAHHLVLGYDFLPAKDFRIKVETYSQRLYDVPVSKAEQQFSVLNSGSEYYLEVQDSMINRGLGYNYGVELTLEKFLNQGYYFLFTASVFDSKYQGYDKVWRNTAFNTNYVFNLLGGYEFKLGKNNFLTFDIKTVWSGGRRKSPIDYQKSVAEGFTVFDNTHAFDSKFKDYFRTDFRIGYKMNGTKISQEWALDLQNVSNTKNLFSQSYNPYSKQIGTTYQQSFMPMMLYRVNF